MFLNLLRGIHVPHRKDTADCPPQRIPIPATVSLPMSMHIGKPALPTVKPGDLVKVGQRIAEPDGPISAPIHASVSGQVRSCGKLLLSNGQVISAVVIDSDGRQATDPSLRPPAVTDYASFLAAVRDSGAVGLGGAGFPTGAKLQVDPAQLETILVNGAECEPYITSDTRTMLDETDLVWKGVKQMQAHLQPRQILLCIEKNKPQCIQRFQALCQGEAGIQVLALPQRYPQGGEKVLLYTALGKVLPEGKLPIDVGAIVINCTTVAAFARYIETGMPLVERCVTVDGGAVAHPQNVIAPIGTALRDLFAFCGGFRREPKNVFYGGPMMAYRLNRPEELEKLKVSLCMRCGCCSYVCPAKRPLVQINKMANLLVRQYRAQERR